MSLSELLISLFLSTLLGSLLLQQYAGLGQSSKQHLALFNQQFEQSLLSRLLSESIHQAGFLPCGNQSTFVIWDASQSRWIRTEALIIKSNQVIANYMDGNFQSMLPEHPNFPVVSKLGGLRSKHTVLITNCFFSELNRIETIRAYGKHFKIYFTFPSRFLIDEDSYIGIWHHDQFDYKQGTMLFGDKKKERLTNNLTHFKVVALRQKLVSISWQYKLLPPFNMFIWTANVPSK